MGINDKQKIYLKPSKKPMGIKSQKVIISSKPRNAQEEMLQHMVKIKPQLDLNTVPKVENLVTVEDEITKSILTKVGVVNVKTRSGLANVLKNVKPKEANQFKRAIKSIENDNINNMLSKGKVNVLQDTGLGVNVYSYKVNNDKRLLFEKDGKETRIIAVADLKDKGKVRII